jgi:hypothetical protein
MVLKNSLVKIPLLTICVLIHSIVGLSSFAFIVMYSLNVHNTIVDIMIACIVVSFLYHKRCVMIDIYEDINKLDGNTDLPPVARDNFLRSLITTDDTDLTHLRLDVIDNLAITKDFFNRKMHYIVTNIILSTLLLEKYNMKIGIPGLIIWMFKTFS